MDQKEDIASMFDDAFRRHKSGDLAGAEAGYKKILQLDPRHHPSLHYFGVIAHKVRQYDIAAQLMLESLRIYDRDPVYYLNLAKVMEAQGKRKEAEGLYNAALNADPACIDALNDLGWLAISRGQTAEAETCFNRALMIDPQHPRANTNLGMLKLLLGDFKAGFALNEWRWKVPGYDIFGLTAPIWDGGDLHGKTILLHGEQGLGDNIQFIRYAEMVKARGANVIMPCNPALVRLFRTVKGIDRIIEEGEAIPHYDCRAPFMSLPHVFSTTLEAIPAKIPYLSADPAMAAHWQERLSGLAGKKIGIVWRGNPGHTNDHNRSMPVEQMAKIFAGLQVALVVLQKDAAAAELDVLKRDHQVVNAGLDLKDFADSAALVKNLDLVVTVDTAVCHLAGALGAKTWTLLAYGPDWRWMLGRADTPWYPTMALFRQRGVDDWASVVRDAAMRLAEEIKD